MFSIQKWAMGPNPNRPLTKLPVASKLRFCLDDTNYCPIFSFGMHKLVCKKLRLKLFCFVFFPDFQLSGNVAVPTRVLSVPTQNYNAVHSGEKNQQLKNRIPLKMYLSP